MIVYYKLKKVLESQGKSFSDLCEAGLSINMPKRLETNKNVSMDTIDKICTYLKVQPGNIMEWIDESKAEESKIQNEIQALQAKIKELERAKGKL